MVRVAVAGGSGNVAREVVDEILSRGIHDVVVLGRGNRPQTLPNAVQWETVDYEDESSLVNSLRGCEALLSFLANPDMDLLVKTQKTLIDAAVRARVRRFAPSEWATRSNSGVAHYAFKDKVREYLEEINKSEKVLEYCLFQPGFFTNYFGYPFSTTNHFHMSLMWADFQNCKAIMVGDGDWPLTLTTVQDMCSIVADALEFEGEWPHEGGICGTQTTGAGLIALGERIRGRAFEIERLTLEDVTSGDWKTSWVPTIDHPGVPALMRDQLSKAVLREYTISLAAGAWSVEGAWNEMLPGRRFTSAETYLSNIWANVE